MTIQELIEELMKFPRSRDVVLVIGNGPMQMVCSGDFSVEEGEDNEVLLAGDDD